MKTTPLFVLLAGLLVFSFGARAEDYATLKEQAEKFYQDKSFSRAREVYQQAGKMKLAPADTRWVSFRLADTLWRSQAATQTADTTQFEKAQHELEVLVRDITRTEDQDRVWAEPVRVLQPQRPELARELPLVQLLL